MPKLCDKCGHYDPAPVLTLGSRCPSCGVIYAQLADRAVAASSVNVADSSIVTTAATDDWGRLTAAQVWTFMVCAGLLFLIIVFDDDGFVLLLDHANLAFHEAGHLYFGVLGSTLGLYGGTLGQLVFPIAAGVSFWRRGQAVGAAISGVWLFENFLNIARYMADARAQRLPLVGGGEHDWFHIFSSWGALSHDTDIAFVTHAAGWAGMIGCVAWLWRRHVAQQRPR